MAVFPRSTRLTGQGRFTDNPLIILRLAPVEWVWVLGTPYRAAPRVGARIATPLVVRRIGETNREHLALPSARLVLAPGLQTCLESLLVCVL